MRVHVSVDLEGINGVVHSTQVMPGESGYERAVSMMHKEANAVIDGALSAGAKYVLVNDSHWDARNLRRADLHPAATLISGWQKPYSMMSGVDNQMDVSLFVGYHARAGSPTGILSHTYRSECYLDVKLNGRSVGETALNAALAGWFGVPVALVTGDDVLCAEAVETLGPVVCVEVKKAISRYSASCPPESEVLDRLRAKTAATLKDRAGWRLFRPESPSTLRLSMFDPCMADGAELLPYVKRVGDREVELSHEDYSVLFRMMLAIGAIASSRRDTYY